MIKKKVISIVLNDFVNDNRVYREGESITKLGFDLRVVALHNEGLPQYEDLGGFSVERIKLKSRKLSKTLFIQFFKYIEFLMRVLKEFRHMDIVHCHDLAALPVGVALKLFSKKDMKVIYDSHEYQAHLHGLSSIQTRGRKLLEGTLLKHVDEVITVSPSIAEAYSKDYGIKRPHVLLNAPKYERCESSNVFKEKYSLAEDVTLFLYQGNLSAGRGVDVILETFKRLSKEEGCIVFMGSGALEGLIKEMAERYENIFYHPPVPSSEIIRHTSSADVGIHFIQNTCLNHDYCLPNKLFEYVMAGLPVIVSAVKDMGDFVKRNGNGLTVNDSSSESLGEAVLAIKSSDLKEMKKRSLELAKLYCWETQERVLEEVYAYI